MSPVKFVPLFLFLLSVSAFSGVEFHDAEIPISDEIKKAFLEDLGSLTVEEETGFNVLKYYKKGAKFPYLTIAHFHGIKMRHEYDLDSDGFAEVVKRKVDGERYVYEELGNFNKKENGHHYRRRYYPLYGTTKAKRVAEYRASLKEQFKVIGSKIVDIRAFSSPKRNKCLKMEMVPMGDSDLLLDVEDVVKRFSIDWTSSLRRAGRLMFPAKIEKS
ncbi:MAG: hypothetical protein NXH75_01100, partial [Halobacteriovoraceae bacterium]|nr:hypothetical protein [Halobacteriovoraceae bacterium]